MKKLGSIAAIILVCITTISCVNKNPEPSYSESAPAVTPQPSQSETPQPTLPTESTSATDAPTDPETEIKPEPLDAPRRFVTNKKAYTQSVCVSDKFVFVSHSPSLGGDKNDYVIIKYDRFTGELIKKGTETLNHANGMAYNKHTNEIAVIGLDGNSSTTTTVGDQDYSLFMVDAETLKIKRTVNLKELITELIPVSMGIGGVAYNEDADRYYVLTRYPDRRIVTLTGNFEYVSDFKIDISAGGTRGDICCDGEFIYTVSWISSLHNIVDVYKLDGTFVKTCDVDGMTHIEGLDRRNGRFYVCFIDFNTSPYSAAVFEMDELLNVK